MESNGQMDKQFGENESNEIVISQRVSFPKRVFFIIGNEFCERFNFNGMRAILVLYLKYKLGYTEDDATILYHGFLMALYLSCLFGGIISDVYLGKFKTVLYLSIVYMIGSTIVALSSIGFNQVGLILGLILIAVGNGGIKPCICAFGGDQFKLPEQAVQLAAFFSWFYFTITLGGLLSTTITPILRKDVHCFGASDCFPLAFGVPAILMFISIVIFLFGQPFYTHQTSSSEDMLLQVTKCITNAISIKIRERHLNPRKQFLDYSIDKYGSELVNDIRALSRILMLYAPMPIFWALFDQTGSRWTFQADKMNGDIGFYTIKPDQIQMLSALMTLLSIPLFETVIYPVLRKFGIRRPLQKMSIGGICLAIAFLVSAIVQFKVESEPERSISMLWLIPQNVIMTMAEVMFQITGLAFSYEQAPPKMKSIVIAFWALTVALGNLCVIPIAKLASFDSQAHEFLLFSALMFVDVLVFMYVAHHFERHNQIKGQKTQL